MNGIGIRLSLRSSAAPWVLSISQNGQDHRDLGKMIDPERTLVKASTLQSGLDALAETQIAVVLCDGDLRPGSWKDVLAHTANCAQPPHLLVTSRLADEALWAEALNLGAYDALAKPFDSEEVRRVVSGAWQNWIRKYEPDRPSKAIHEYAPAWVQKFA